MEREDGISHIFIDLFMRYNLCMHDFSHSSKFELPTIFVILGVTGDLVKKKILKALYHLYRKKRLPERFRVYGFSRRDYDDVKLRSYLRDIMLDNDYQDPELFDEFLASFYYVQGDFHIRTAYKNLAKTLGRIDGEWSICSNKLFYLAVPPASYSDIVTNLHESGLTKPCSPQEGWTRVILEKPFGTDLQTARDLDQQLGQLFQEEQIYRVDHYLGKETVKNILVFRFSNLFLTPSWNKNYIEKIEIRLLEKIGVEGRGEFYDKIGALRDVGQNHMLQLLGLFIMDQPYKFIPEDIKNKRSEALASLHVMSEQEVIKQTMRGQYEGYTKEEGVDPQSKTETYFHITARSELPDFVGVPLILESGKTQKCEKIEVEVTFKETPLCLYDIEGDQKNTFHYHIKPDEKISMKFFAKKPGFDTEIAEHELGFDYRKAYEKNLFIDDYESLLFDIIKGDQTLFVSTEEILNEWRFIEPIVQTWREMDKPKLKIYEKGKNART
ncbi:MAG: Glucose-6-phosphate 1-dehydrogenase [Candidatus Roizmanbacteria bacterium GW2011_GWA2_37_7]|uniref:Glucose-6-phosphate 1-dehydrogenase n=1 Tax=Candidatus Roizmanbacteria bacterium GW2011_GWA2_37_7 TaxID=1618481 RepID=A0A0G0HI34_9BACT|nr:MAG: Glucose-6-phosphate 1-dehydrogenase [Candidatus Roizmanbacteria bacterium GW2011_GWA2_37_7]